MGKSQSRVTLRKVNCVSGAWCAPWDESLGVRLHSRNNVDSTGKNGRSCILQSGKDSRPVLAFPFVGLLMADGKTTPWGSLDAFLSRSFAAWQRRNHCGWGCSLFARRRDHGCCWVTWRPGGFAQYSSYSQNQKLYTKKNLVSPLTLIRIILT